MTSFEEREGENFRIYLPVVVFTKNMKLEWEIRVLGSFTICVALPNLKSSHIATKSLFVISNLRVSKSFASIPPKKPALFFILLNWDNQVNFPVIWIVLLAIQEEFNCFYQKWNIDRSFGTGNRSYILFRWIKTIELNFLWGKELVYIFSGGSHRFMNYLFQSIAFIRRIAA